LPFIDRAVRDRDCAIQTAAGKLFADDYVSTLQRHLTSTGAGRLGEAYGFGEAARHGGISIPRTCSVAPQISAKTAESHRTKIMEKLDVRGTAGLVRYAVRRGLIRA